MKIGILTYHFVSNFGANLQTLSTFGYLKNAGHEPIIINWIPEDLENYYKTVVPDEQNNAFKDFAKKRYTSISDICRNSRDIAKVIDREKIELVVIGSDAVLTYIPILCRIHLTRKGVVYSKPCIDSDFPNAFWGDFITHTKTPVRLAIMSGSAQNTNYSKILFRKAEFKRALEHFSFISVRDIWTKMMIESLSNGAISPDITPDPVFAFNQNVSSQYTREYIVNKFGLKADYVLFTIDNEAIGDDWKIKLEKDFGKNGLTLYELPQANKTHRQVLKHALRFPIDPMEWYCLIKYSKGYIGELMHPILCSLHNSVPVYAIDTYGFKSNRQEYGINPLSSKTYQIISRYNLLANYCNINKKSSLSSPSEVVDKILSFDKEKCTIKSLNMLKSYNAMMSNILNK